MTRAATPGSARVAASPPHACLPPAGRHVACARAQIIRFEVRDGVAVRETGIDTSAVSAILPDGLPGSATQHTDYLCVRVVSADATETALLIGARSEGYDVALGGWYSISILIYGSVPAGGYVLEVTGIAVLPAPTHDFAGVFALSQTSAVSPGWVLASTGSGVYKCAPVPFAVCVVLCLYIRC